MGGEEEINAWVRLGRLIRRARSATQENAETFAARAGISIKTLYRLEAGRVPSRTRTLVAIDRGFGWPLGTTEDILAGADLPQVTPIRQAPAKSAAELAIEASEVFTTRQKRALIEELHRLQAETERRAGDQTG